jgi:hypothetical protein
VAYKIYDHKFEWKGNFDYARTCIKQALEQIDYPEDLNIFNHTDLTQMNYSNVLFVKPTAPTSKHFAIDTIGYANASKLAFEEPYEPDIMYSHLNSKNNMDWSKIETLINQRSNKWDDSILLKWRKAKDVPKEHILVIGQMPDDETVKGFGLGGHWESITLIVERLYAQVTEFPIVVKIHPRLKLRGKQKDIVDKWIQDGIDVRDGYESIHDFLPHTRVAILDNSTAGIECLMHEVPIISYGFPEYHWVTKQLQSLTQLPKLCNDISWHKKEKAMKFIYWYINDYLCYDVESTKNRLNEIFNISRFKD